MDKFSIIIHGGAGKGSKKLFKKMENILNRKYLEKDYLDSLEECIELGKDFLIKGYSATNVVERCISYLEDNELFNAGRGSVKDKNGEIFHDACIVDGLTKKWGSTCLINRVKNPIQLAYILMLNHNTIIGGNKNALLMCKEYNIPTVKSSKYFHSEYRDIISKLSSDLGTVGAVVMDIYGNIAAGTSTGGRQNKLPGRIGDTPLNGISTIAENGYIGLSCTGDGEEIITNHTASQILYRYKFNNCSLKKAIKETLKDFKLGSCGVIGIDKLGNPCYYCNTQRFYVASYVSNERTKIHLFE